jgi:hypothetical protein
LRLSRLVLTAIALVMAPRLSLAAVEVVPKPVPGIPIIVKQCPTGCTSHAIALPGGFLGPGTPGFAGTVQLLGRCLHTCSPCDADCGGGSPDGRFDYVEATPAGPFEMTLSALTLYSASPIDVGGTLYDVLVTLSGPSPLADDPMSGSLLLPPGAVLPVGGVAPVQSSALDAHATITFALHATGEAVGGALEQDLHLVLQGPSVPLERIAGSTPEGVLVLGSDGVTVEPFRYAGDGLDLTLLSVRSLAPVATRARTWGALKAIYR